MLETDQRSRRGGRRRDEALTELANRLKRVVGTQIAGGATPSPLLIALGSDGRVRVWPVPPDFPQTNLHQRRATGGLLRSLIARFDSVAYGLVLTVPPPPSGQDPAVLAWTRGLGPGAQPVMVHVSDGLTQRASGAVAHRDLFGSGLIVAWREVAPLETLLARLDEPLSLRRQEPSATRAA